MCLSSKLSQTVSSLTLLMQMEQTIKPEDALTAVRLQVRNKCLVPWRSPQCNSNISFILNVFLHGDIDSNLKKNNHSKGCTMNAYILMKEVLQWWLCGSFGLCCVPAVAVFPHDVCSISVALIKKKWKSTVPLIPGGGSVSQHMAVPTPPWHFQREPHCRSGHLPVLAARPRLFHLPPGQNPC